MLYRRWPTRTALLEAVIRHRGAIDAIEVPDTGSLRGDVLTVLTDFNDRRAGIIGGFAALFGAYFDETGGSPQQLRALFMSDGPKAMETIVERAVRRGDLPAMPPARIVALPADLLRHELFMTMAAVSRETIEEIVDDVFLPLVTRQVGEAETGSSGNQSRAAT